MNQTPEKTIEFNSFLGELAGHRLEIRFDGELIVGISYDSTVKRPNNDQELKTLLQEVLNSLGKYTPENI